MKWHPKKWTAPEGGRNSSCFQRVRHPRESPPDTINRRSGAQLETVTVCSRVSLRDEKKDNPLKQTHGCIHISNSKHNMNFRVQQ